MSTLLYNPDRKAKSQLIAEFVVRTRVYDEILHDLETSEMKYPEQHYLIVGQRGTGKTTLLHRLRYGIEDSATLNGWLIPVLFTEEQYNITELANFWEYIGQQLEDDHGFAGICGDMERQSHRKDFEEACFDILERYLHSYQKKLVLLVDNIGDLLKKMEKTEVHRLREILQTKKEIRLIAGSPFYLESILDYQQPLFDFFKVVRLDGLNRQETQALLLKLGEISGKKDHEKIERIITQTPERIETLRTLAGGMPRTIALMFRIFIDYNDEDSVKDLERILDAVTPLYKHRMDDLPVQQQKIVDAVARNWDAISVKELKERVRLESKAISAQLRQLEKNGVIDKRETNTKNHLYLLNERFFNIWYLMRYGRKDDRQRVIWLVRFLESWCSSEDLKMRILNYVEKIKTGTLDDSAVQILGQVYAALKNIDAETRLLLKKSTPVNISRNVVISNEELLKTLRKYANEENWDKVLTIALEADSRDYAVQELTYWAAIELIQKDPENENLRLTLEQVKNLLDGITGKKSLTEALSVESEIIRVVATFTIIKQLGEKKLDLVFYFIDLLFLLTKEEDLLKKNFEHAILPEVLCLIMAYGHFNLLNKIFNDIKHPDLKAVFQPVYYAFIYLKDGKDSTEFLKAGPEIREAVDNVLALTQDYKKQIDSKKGKAKAPLTNAE